MKQLAQAMTKEWGTMVYEELWLMYAISNYCYAHGIELSEDEENDLIEMLMDDDY